MKQLFKSTLLAAAVAATCGTAVAGDVDVDTKVYSLEGMAGSTATSFTSNDFKYVLDSAYTEGDRLVFKLAAGTLTGNESFPATLSAAAVDLADTTDGNTESETISGVDFSRVDTILAGEGEMYDRVIYRVLSITAPQDANGDEISGATTKRAEVAGDGASLVFPFTKTQLMAGTATVTVESTLAGTNGTEFFDMDGDRTALLGDTRSEFSTTITSMAGFDRKIDVASVRNSFFQDTGDTDQVTDDLSFALPALTLGTGETITDGVNSADLKVVVYGEPGQMTELTDSMFAVTATTAAGDALSPTFELDSEAAMLKVTYPNAGTNGVTSTITFTAPTGAGAVELQPQEFTADLSYMYTSTHAENNTGTFVVGTSQDAGEWTLNGANVNVPYMPYGDNISQILYVTNTGTQEGAIHVEAFDSEGETYDLGQVSTAKAGAVTKITVPVNQALELAGLTDGRVSLNITVNAADEDITVYSAYTVGTVRGYVNTDQYKGK